MSSPLESTLGAVDRMVRQWAREYGLSADFRRSDYYDAVELRLSTRGYNSQHWVCQIDAEALMHARYTGNAALFDMVKEHFMDGVAALAKGMMESPKIPTATAGDFATTRAGDIYKMRYDGVWDEVRAIRKEKPTPPVLPKEWGEEAP